MTQGAVMRSQPQRRQKVEGGQRAGERFCHEAVCRGHIADGAGSCWSWPRVSSIKTSRLASSRPCHVLPLLAPVGDVRAIWPAGVQALFLNVMPSRAEKCPERAEAGNLHPDRRPARPGSPAMSDPAFPAPQSGAGSQSCAGPASTVWLMPAHRQSRRAPRPSETLQPPHDRGDAHAEYRRGGTARATARHRGSLPGPANPVNRVSACKHWPPRPPASILSSKPPRLGIVSFASTKPDHPGADPLSRPTIILSGLASSAQDCRTFRG